MAAEQVVCAAEELADGGDGVRFELKLGERAIPAFAVRFRGQVHAYLNMCPHAFTELDWLPGKFFDSSGLYVICATHGACFTPESGFCIAGPCRGQRLSRVHIAERDGAIVVTENTKAEDT